MLPTFVIAGVPRAGTTSLAAYLAAHREIFMATPKELHFFNSRFERGLDWYASHFVDAGAAAHRGEATPAYLVRDESVARLAATLPDARVIVVLREPVERAYSHYWLNRWRGIEALSFEAALDAEDRRLERRPEHTQYAYFGMGDYTTQLRRLQSCYSSSQIHTIYFDDLRARPTDVVLQLCRYLGVAEEVPTDAGARHNHHGPVRSARVAMLARHLPGPVCTRVRGWNTRDGDYPPLDPNIRAVLQERFRHANRGLSTLTGASVPWYGDDVGDYESQVRRAAR